MFLQLTKTAPAGDTVFRKQSASIRPIFIVLALIPTVGYFINGRFNVWQIVIFWTIVLYDITISLLTKKLKPIAIVIDSEELKLNNQIKTSRNLASLKSMSLNGFTDYIKLTFTNQSDLSIKRNDFSNEDIQKMIEHFGRKSKEQLIISENLKNI